MGTLNRVWVATLTQRQPFAGTDSGLSLRMFGMGGNTLVDRKLSRRHPYDEEMAQAGLYEVSGVRVPRVNLASAEVGIRGGDMWMPRFVFVWGDVNGREPEPIGIFPRGPIPLGSGISTDRSEGPPSLPLAIVPPGDANTGIDRLILVVRTSTGIFSGTDDPIELTLRTAHRVVAQPRIVDTTQADFERGLANLYVLEVQAGFMRRELTEITIRNRGADGWKPESVFLFGCEDWSLGIGSTPKSIVPLVYDTRWTEGWLEDDWFGRSEIRLPIVT